MIKKHRFSKIVTLKVLGVSVLIAFISLMTSKPALSDHVDIDMAQGWNLISLPILPNNNATETLLSGLVSPTFLYYYDVSIVDPLNRWKIWDSTAPPVVNTLTSMEPNKSYWLWSSGAQTLSFDGTIPTNNSVALYPLIWEMVSFQSLTGTVESVFNAMGLTGVRYLYDYDALEPDFHNRWHVWDSTAPPGGNTLTSIEATKGYLLYAGQGEVTIPPIPSEEIWVNPVPEPATMLLLASGLAGLAGFRRKFTDR